MCAQVAARLGVTLGVLACGGVLTPMPPPRDPAPSNVTRAAPVKVAPAPSPAELLRGRRLMVPVEGVGVDRLVDSYEAQRDNGARRHQALDIPAPRGTPVLASDDGQVLRMGFNSLGGLTIFQTDPQRRFTYYYAHLDRYGGGLRDGSDVKRGDIIGYVGSSGNAAPSAPHLHFQVLVYRERYWEGEPLNPMGAFALSGKRR
ncbi:MAG: M23 family metallopeptidase [Gemmatimonadaceae bacterium]